MLKAKINQIIDLIELDIISSTVTSYNAFCSLTVTLTFFCNFIRQILGRCSSYNNLYISFLLAFLIKVWHEKYYCKTGLFVMLAIDS